MIKAFLFFHLTLFSGLLLPAQICSKKAHGNAAKDIVDIINKNRTAIKHPALYDSAGLGCMALQYAEECKANCTSNNTVTCRPSEDNFAEVYAPDCGVELPTVSSVSGKIVGCWSKYLTPSEAFSQVLVRDKKSLSLISNKTHTEVGVGVASTHKGHYFWCVLFSSGQTSSSFMLENRGQGIKQKQGCFSGTNTTRSCNGGSSMRSGMFSGSFMGVFTLVVLHLICVNVDILFYV
ncbi:Plectin [Bienertia sinuspersici]